MCVERRDCPIECLAGEPRIYNVAIDIKQSRREATGRRIGSSPIDTSEDAHHADVCANFNK